MRAYWERDQNLAGAIAESVRPRRLVGDDRYRRRARRTQVDYRPRGRLQRFRSINLLLTG